MPEIPKSSKNAKGYKGYSGPAPQADKADEKEYKGYEPPAGKGSRTVVMALIAVMLLLVVLGGGVLIFLFMAHPVPGPPVPQPPGPGANATANVSANLTCDDQCMLQNAVSSGSADECLNISNVSTRQTCYLLLSNTSVSVCLRLESEAAQVECVSHHAVLNNDLSICSLLAEPGATSCMAAINPCYARNGTPRLLCLALASKNYTMCGSNRECVLNYSQATGNVDACSQLTLVADQFGCWAMVSGKDKCSDLTLQSQKDLCYEVFAIRTDDHLLCQAITPDSLYQTECLSYFSARLGDYHICDAGLTLNNRWICYSNYSLVSGDISGCAGISPYATTARFKCYYAFAISWGNPSVCDQFGDPSEINSCYVGSIMNNTRLNYSNCAAIGLSQWKNKCYTAAAKLANDSSICEYIQTQSEMNSCLSNIK
jgi:hypothetical protein